jgi:hypothetical protein
VYPESNLGDTFIVGTGHQLCHVVRGLEYLHKVNLTHGALKGFLF